MTILRRYFMGSALAALLVALCLAPVQAQDTALKLGVGMFQPDREKNDATYRPLAQYLATRLGRRCNYARWTAGKVWPKAW